MYNRVKIRPFSLKYKCFVAASYMAALAFLFHIPLWIVLPLLLAILYLIQYILKKTDKSAHDIDNYISLENVKFFEKQIRWSVHYEAKWVALHIEYKMHVAPPENTMFRFQYTLGQGIDYQQQKIELSQLGGRLKEMELQEYLDRLNI